MVPRWEKFTYKVTMVFGDIYYEKIPADTAIERCFKVIQGTKYECKTKQDLEMFVEDNLNVKIPLDGPQWRAFVQPFKDPETGKDYYIQIWKQHHSFMDGMSSMGMIGSMAKGFGPSMFIPFKSVPLWQRLLLRMVAPFSVFTFLVNMLNARDRNILTKGKRTMTG